MKLSPVGVKEVKLQRKINSMYKVGKDLSLFLLALPVILWIFIFSYLPMGGLVLAFKDYRIDKGIFGSPWNGLKNFEFIFKTSDAWKVVSNTIGYNLVFILLGLLIPVTVALMLYEIGNRFSLKFYQTTMFFPHFLSWAIVAYMAYTFLNPRLGIMNGFLKVAGIQPIDWYGKPEYWYTILPVANTWKHVGYSTLFYYAALMGIDKEYFEAAEIDGASKYRQILNISIPSLVPLMIMMTVLALGRVIRADFGLFYQLPMNSPMLYSATDVIDTYLYRALTGSATASMELGMTAAIGLLQAVVGFILVVVTNMGIRKIRPEDSLY